MTYRVGSQPPKGYMEWHEWAEDQERGGRKQKLCPYKRWHFPQEKCQCASKGLSRGGTDVIPIDDGLRFACGCPDGYGGARDEGSGWWFWHGANREAARWFSDSGRGPDGKMAGLADWLSEVHDFLNAQPFKEVN